MIQLTRGICKNNSANYTSNGYSETLYSYLKIRACMVRIPMLISMFIGHVTVA